MSTDKTEQFPLGPLKVYQNMGNGEQHWIVSEISPDVPLAKVNYFPHGVINKAVDPEVTGLAYAQLFASVPDLLEALENMVRLFHGYQGMELTEAKAAIAKARGTS